MLKQNLALGGQLYTPGASGKKGKAQAVLQLSDGLGDRRLADIKLLGCSGDISRLGNLEKNFIL